MVEKTEEQNKIEEQRKLEDYKKALLNPLNFNYILMEKMDDLNEKIDESNLLLRHIVHQLTIANEGKVEVQG